MWPNIFGKKKNLEVIKKMVESADANIQNKQLYEKITYTLKDAISDTKLKVLTNDTTIMVKEKNGDIVSISFIPSIESIDAIEVDEVFWNGNGKHSILVEFFEDTVTVTERKSARYSRMGSSECYAIGNNVTKKTYIDNQLRYSYELDSYTPYDSDKEHSYSNLSEMYTDGKGSAVKKQVSINESDDLATKVYYSETEYCDEIPFNDRIDNKTVYIYGMSSTTEEVFNSFAKNQKDVLRKKLNQT